MPEQQYLNPNSMSQPRGYTQVVKAGNTVYIAGQVSVAEDGSVVGKGDASCDYNTSKTRPRRHLPHSGGSAAPILSHQGSRHV